ncbi:CGNR zinc finger domain-containing protein [Micromonospora sp. WMMD1120]|uniref:CGNR zinc finger domain-containing protein n=1 Tax=Micromonospora sp. WMMD1120 TaxID=3016106 RepID=UPI0024172B19|nr:ABATE domain-containing protein [Micromonospora sp. WMMD1120]MDG4808764.1 CGNR zinc finger domain-containing protein [Micromonospora sp. WMMD1120]
METPVDVTRMRLVGGNIALDLVNTRSGPPVGPPDDDVLTGYPELVAWGAYTGVLDKPEAAALRRLSRADPAGARAAFGLSLRIRDDIDEVFRAVASGRSPTAPALTRLRDHETEALGHAHLDGDNGFGWTWRADRTLARPVRPVVHAAVELLTAGTLDRIKACEGCRFLFTDESKNRSRRWCSMDDCGKSAKIRRYVAARRTRRTAHG